MIDFGSVVTKNIPNPNNVITVGNLCAVMREIIEDDKAY